MSEALDALSKIADWQQQHAGRQQMQLVVLRWALKHRDAMRANGLADSLLAEMDAEITTHRAARPQGTP